MSVADSGARPQAPLVGAARRALSPALLLVCLLTALWIAFFAWSAVMRHAMFRSSALDLGYMTQAARIKQDASQVREQHRG